MKAAQSNTTPHSGLPPSPLASPSPGLPCANALLTDSYQLTMLNSYYENQRHGEAVFELFFRSLPKNRNFLLCAGIELALDHLEQLSFTGEDIDWLSQNTHLSPKTLSNLKDFIFTGDVDAISEGTPVFGLEPVLRIKAPLPQAQLIETRLINLIHYSTAVASKAIRCVLAAQGKTLIDFGLRRAHGQEASLLCARSSYLAGFAATATVLAGKLFEIPLAGTMAHSLVQACSTEKQAFLEFARAQKKQVTLLIDTYDITRAAATVVEIAPELGRDLIHIDAVRIDSGDLGQRARQVRHILDQGGLTQTKIVVSGNLDEYKIDTLVKEKAPIDSFGVGTLMSTCDDAPSLECVYKLQQYEGINRQKLSEGKKTLTGIKQVYRQSSSESNSHTPKDRIVEAHEKCEGTPLIQPVMRGGKRLSQNSLNQLKMQVPQKLEHIPEKVKSLQTGDTHRYCVEISQQLFDHH